MYNFRFFRAIDDPMACAEFSNGHRKILADYGVSNITTLKEKWHNDPDTFVITAADSHGEIVGGIRIQRSYGSILPIGEAIGYKDEGILKYLNKDYSKGTAEICGLWNAKKVFGRGVSPLLARTAVAYSIFLEINSLYCFVAPYTLNLAESIGFTVLNDLGENGQFEYPTKKFISSALRIGDLEGLPRAETEQRKRILSLRRRPNQSFIEQSQKKNVAVVYQDDYNIKIGKAKG